MKQEYNRVVVLQNCISWKKNDFCAIRSASEKRWCRGKVKEVQDGVSSAF